MKTQDSKKEYITYKKDYSKKKIQPKRKKM